MTCSQREPNPAPLTEQTAHSIRDRYLKITESWTSGITFRDFEQEAMQRGRRWEDLMTRGLDDPLAKKVLAAGEPSYDTLCAYYPGKILDRTVLGTYSDPRHKNGGSDDEFVVWWNGAVSADLRKGRLAGAVQPIAHNTNILFRVGEQAEIFGQSGDAYSRAAYEDGYLPIVRAGYRHNGITYEQTVFAGRPAGETRGADIAYVRFHVTNTSRTERNAELHAELILMDDTRAAPGGPTLLNTENALLLAHSDRGARFDAAKQRLTHVFELKAGASAELFLKIPYRPDSLKLLKPAGRADFENAYRRVRESWLDLLASGAKIQVPEERVNNVWRALLLQNFILADGARFTYGSGLRYNDSYYPQENGFGAHTFAMYGFEEYANALLPYCVPVSVNSDLAGRKYQNRRAMPFHHLFENYRLTQKSEVFDKHKEDFFRVAEEIIADRRSTMEPKDGEKPLHWGLLSPDRPGVDLRASTQTVYVVAHNITNCQGLQDFGEFLVRTGIDPQRGRRYLREAQGFRRTLLSAMERSAIHVPERPPFVPLETLYFRDTPDYGPEPFEHLGLGRLQGAYYHYWADMEFQYNFFNPDDPVGKWIADYIAQRGGFVLGCTRARPRPETPYGWINNVYNAGYYNYRLRRDEISEFLLGFYSRLAFGMSRNLYVASEGSPFIRYNTQNGGFVSADYSFPNSAANAETLSMLRLMLVMEELKDNLETGDIYLLRGAPRAWLEDGKQIQVGDAPTYFGPISFTLHSRLNEKLISASVTPPREEYRKIILSLRHPQKARIKKVLVNGSEHKDVDLETGKIRLASGPARFEIEVHYP